MTTFTLTGVGAAGEGSHFGVSGLNDGRMLTSMKNGSGNLELNLWRLDESKPLNASVTHVARGGAGSIDEAALATIGQRAVTAVRAGDGRLLLISWDIPSGANSINRLKDSGHMAGEASQIAMTALRDGMLVTALKNGSDDLMLISWTMGQDGSFTRLGDSNAGRSSPAAGHVDLVKIVAVADRDVVTGVKNGSGNLELIAWRLSQDGKTFRRMTTAPTDAGHIDEIAMTTFSGELGAPSIFTAVRNGSGNLQIMKWNSVDGNAFLRVADTNALPPGQKPGTAEKISVCHISDTIIASMRRGTGDLELIAFDTVLRRMGELVHKADPDVQETVIAEIVDRAVVASKRAGILDLRTFRTSEAVARPGVSEMGTSIQVAPMEGMVSADSPASRVAAMNAWFASALANPAKAKRLGENWRDALFADVKMTPEQRDNLSQFSGKDADELQSAIKRVIAQGGSITIEQTTENGPGGLTIRPMAAQDRVAPQFSLGIFHCTFDANFRNWHCHWGPG